MLYGIIVYEILENGNLLHGIYTNNLSKNVEDNHFVINMEIARKIKNEGKGVSGEYECMYTEIDSKMVVREQLTIKKVNGVYEFKWESEVKKRWIGLGLMSGNNHIAVSYTES